MFSAFTLFCLYENGTRVLEDSVSCFCVQLESYLAHLLLVTDFLPGLNFPASSKALSAPPDLPVNLLQLRSTAFDYSALLGVRFFFISG